MRTAEWVPSSPGAGLDLKLTGKVVVVTGGARGIGEAITRALAAENAIPCIIGRDRRENQHLVDELHSLGHQADQVVAELNEPAQCYFACQEVLSRHPDIYGLVNNAGVNDGVSLANGEYQSFIASLHANVVHYFLVTQQLLPRLKCSQGSIVNITSKVAETGQGGTSGYAAANGARNSLTREWAVELLPASVRVNAVVVAECMTPAYENWLATFPNPGEIQQRIEARIPFGQRTTTPDEIANTVAFLISPCSSHTTGQLVHVDGGYVHLDRALIRE